MGTLSPPPLPSVSYKAVILPISHYFPPTKWKHNFISYTGWGENNARLHIPIRPLHILFNSYIQVAFPGDRYGASPLGIKDCHSDGQAALSAPIPPF